MLKMPLPRFAAWSAAGTVAWTAALTVAGYALGQQYTQVERYVGPVSTAITVLVVIGYGWRVARWHRKP
jgi:membrane protein DedA with SNARE-associated domain